MGISVRRLTGETERKYDAKSQINMDEQLLEATLFCLKSITEEISPEENVYIQQLFGLDILGRFPNNCSARLTNTSLLLMGTINFMLAYCFSSLICFID